ncbi:MAG: Hsp20/alpha crystallin family protein [Pseudohongiellaceae bacterium]
MPISVWHPSTDVFHCDEKWFVKMELAGVQPDELSIRSSEGTLLVSGCRRDIVRQDNLNYHSLEINYCQFERRVMLPFTIDSSSIRWDYSNGMLLIELGRATEA